MKKTVIHLLANAHLDPVWLWDWREGLNEGITTVRTILDLMDEDPKMTFIRGESAIYEHIQAHDPGTFERVRQYVRKGRWDIVGGTYIQPDTNLPATETLARQFHVAQAYFRNNFDFVPKVAWAADSFGHSAGFPEILAAAGISYFAFTRPDKKQVALEHPAFWWESASGARILAYRPTVGWYGAERDEIFRRLDGYLQDNEKYSAQNIGCFYGLGNHGGGPSRRQLDDIRRWADKNPQVEVIHSGLHRFFDAILAEERERGTGYPVHRGELNFCLRGCYASVAKFKFPYRRTEAHLARAEKTNSIISASLGRPPADLETAWKSLLFNSFHDILPGSSIERAYDDQLAWLGAAYHESQRAELNALNALASRIDTTVPEVPYDAPSRVPVLVWNPHPHEYSGPVEIEAALDYRPLWDYENRFDEVPVELFGPKGTAVPFQIIETENSSMRTLPWRKRVVFQAKLPAMGWSVFQIGLARRMKVREGISPAKALTPGTIRNKFYRISARKGAKALQIYYKGKPLFAGAGLSVIKLADPWGSWGGMLEEGGSIRLSKIEEKWKIDAVDILEKGPERASLWVRFAGANSRIDLTLSLARNRAVVDGHARVLWNERSCRLKILFPVGNEAEFDVPGGIARRGICGEVPGGRWVKTLGKQVSFGLATNALYGFSCEKEGLTATVVRASRYANDVKTAAHEELWRPVVDAGELTFQFLITTDTASLPRLAQNLEQPPLVQIVPPSPGDLPVTGSLFSLSSSNAQLIALKPAENGRGWIVRVQEIAGKKMLVRGLWLNQEIELGVILPRSLASFRLTEEKGHWSVTPTNVQEA